MNYADAGVDIDAGNKFVESIKPLALNTARSGATAELGGFGGLIDLKAAGFKDPILVASTDGIGSKLTLALQEAHHQMIGWDLVAMCVNDIVTHGAEPLAFLDYMALPRLDTVMAGDVVEGIARGCIESGCALIGGETARHSNHSTIDMAGLAIGAYERGMGLPRTDIEPGDVVLGLASNGLHCNGFSLVRRLLTDVESCRYLEPTRIYVKSCLAAHRTGKVKAMAHITGGGLIGNLPRMLPFGNAIQLARGWPLPQVFHRLKVLGISDREMLRVFNCGIGLAVVVAPEDEAEIRRVLTDHGETVYLIGGVFECEAGARRVTVDGL